MPDINQFRDHKIVVIESYGSDKKPVRTCCHFIEKDGCLFTRSPVTTQNVERLRARPVIRVAPAHEDNVPCGEWIDASASVTVERDTDWVTRAMLRKYGWPRLARLVREWLRRGCRRRQYAIIEIAPTTR